MGQFFARGVEDHAAERRDTNASGQEHRRPRGIVVQSQIAEGAVDLDRRSKRDRSEHAFASRISHARRHHQVFFLRAAGNRKSACIPFCIRLGRIDQGHIHGLAGLECPAGRLFEVKCKSLFGDLPPAYQFAQQRRACSRCAHHLPPSLRSFQDVIQDSEDSAKTRHYKRQRHGSPDPAGTSSDPQLQGRSGKQLRSRDVAGLIEEGVDA